MATKFNPQELLKFVFLTFLAIFFLNFLFQGILLRSWNDSHLQGVLPQRDTLNMPPLILNYLLQSFGLVFIVRHLNTKKDYKQAAILGALYGALIFLNFGFSLLFLLPTWPPAILITDTIATTIIFSLSALVITWLDKKS